MSFDPDTYWEARHKAHGLHAVSRLGDARSTTEQVRLLAPELQEAIGMNPGAVLDFGCGWGRFGPTLMELHPHTLDGVDVSPTAFDLSRAFYDNLENRPGALYDVIVAVTVFQHVREDARIEALQQWMSAGGRVVAVELDPRTVPDPASHVFPRSPSELADLFGCATYVAKPSALKDHYLLTLTGC